MSSSGSQYQFGPYTFDPEQQELVAGETKVSLPTTLNKLLTLFVSRPQRLITRAEIAESLWEEQGTVDIENGINGAIRRLRNQLGSTGATGAEEYVQTVIGAGYRFAVAVTVLSPGSVAAPLPVPAGSPVAWADQPATATFSPVAPADESVAPSPPANGEVPRARFVPTTWWGLGAFGGVVLLAGALLLLRTNRAEGRAGEGGRAGAASLEHLKWRPVTFQEVDDGLATSAISPDAEQLAFVSHAGLTIRSLTHKADWTVALPPGFVPSHLAWFPEGDRLLVSGSRSGVPASDASPTGDVTFAVRVGVGRPELWMDDAGLATPSPDRQAVAFVRRGDAELWVAAPDGSHAERRITAVSGSQVSWLAWSGDARRLAVVRLLPRPGDDKAEEGALVQLREQRGRVYQSYWADSGREAAPAEAVPFERAAFLPDGRLLYAVTGPSGIARIGVLPTDRATGAVLPGQDAAVLPDVGENAYKASSFSASSDGRTLAALLERPAMDVYAAELHWSGTPSLGTMERVTRRSGTAYPTGWSPDGQSILFDEGQMRQSSIAEIAVGGTAKRVVADTINRDVMGQYTPDGKWVLFLEDTLQPRAMTVLRTPAAGGTPAVVYRSATLLDFHCSRSAFGRCLLRERTADGALAYFELTAEGGRGRELLRTPALVSAFGDWSLSPDGSRIATTDHDEQHPAVLLRELSDSTGSRLVRLPVEGHGTVLGASWASNGRGLFVQTNTDPAYHLLYVEAGRLTELLKSADPVWGITSRDGRRLAFPFRTPQNRNVWVTAVPGAESPRP